MFGIEKNGLKNGVSKWAPLLIVGAIFAAIVLSIVSVKSCTFSPSLSAIQILPDPPRVVILQKIREVGGRGTLIVNEQWIDLSAKAEGSFRQGTAQSKMRVDWAVDLAQMEMQSLDNEHKTFTVVMQRPRTYKAKFDDREIEFSEFSRVSWGKWTAGLVGSEASLKQAVAEEMQASFTKAINDPSALVTAQSEASKAVNKLFSSVGYKCIIEWR